MARGTVLIADDDTAIRTVLNQALVRAGYAPRVTGNAATLWRWVKVGRFVSPVKLGDNVTAWKIEEVRAWLDARSATK